ncbi:hypothetical protein C5L14_16875 [Labrys okinawensis]|uniref:AMP-dependent synthetase/ligase domain-containing protein n=1 Tax=Labrys okinawensis TaxID=346911 RepID=A0A2S9QC82_9HYPH|nr:class I adenylate-forming enzyme family protein [Labrys okinawensis]PRH86957.1 hypothetical protein C5L14_16875 [Labrys okinawensis]
MTSDITPRIAPAPSTLDQLLRISAQPGGDTLALVDAPDRPLWADGAPRRLTWNQVDAAVSAVAGRFFEMGLPSEALVCVQGLNVTDTLIALLGCIRAGLVAVIVPIDFSPAEIVGVAERLNAKAILAARRMGDVQSLRPLRHLVDESIADIRFIGAFGADLPGGTVSFEDCIGYPRTGVITRLSRRERPEESLAIMTIDRGPDGDFAVARNHRQWQAASSVLVAELGLSRTSRLLCPMAPSGLAGLAGGLVSWLSTGCQLILHQAFDATVFAVQMTMHGVTHALLPDTVLRAGLVDGLFDSRKLEKVAGLARAPHAAVIPGDAPCPTPHFAVLGEIGIVPMRALEDGGFGLEALVSSQDDAAPPLVEAGIEESGYLALRGQEVSGVGFDVSEREASYPLAADGWVSTSYPASGYTERGVSLVEVTGARYGKPMEGQETAQFHERGQGLGTSKSSQPLAGAA